MSFECITHRPQELFASVDKTSSDLNDQQDVRSFHQDAPLVEQIISSEANATISALTLHTAALLGIASDTQSNEQNSQQSELELSNIKFIRQTRRAVWEQTGYIPPITGGSPKRIDLPTKEIVREYLNSTSVTELAQLHGVSKGTIYSRLHETGLPKHTTRMSFSSPGFSERSITSEGSKRLNNAERQFCWWRDLSPNAQKLYEILVEEGGDRDLLPPLATILDLDLDSALKELQEFNCLDESNSFRYKLK